MMRAIGFAGAAAAAVGCGSAFLPSYFDGGAEAAAQLEGGVDVAAPLVDAGDAGDVLELVDVAQDDGHEAAAGDAAAAGYCCDVDGYAAAGCAETPFLCGGGGCAGGCMLGVACFYCTPGTGGPGEPPCGADVEGTVAPCQ